MPTVPTPRMRISTAQMDHFIAFITSPHIIQDLPFGERTIMLTTKETIKVPNVIQMIPAQVKVTDEPRRCVFPLICIDLD